MGNANFTLGQFDSKPQNRAKGSLNIGNAVGDFLGFDITPGYNMTWHGPVSNAKPKSTDTTPSQTVKRPVGNVDTGQVAATYAGGPAGGSSSGASTADEQAYYDDQINALNKLLGVVKAQRDSGLSRLNASFGDQNKRLGEQQTKTMAGYDQQSLQNAQDKQHGVESVDQFANNSYNSLQGLLRGANAGNSSVARELVPYLISKGAGTRRAGVFDQAGRNDQNIASARGDAQDQFKYSFEDLANQRKDQEQQFREGILNKESDLLDQRRALEIARAQADGTGYEQARQAAAASQAGIEDRQNQLAALFGQFKPTFNARAMNLKTPELGQFTVDPAQISADQNLPSESSYYLTQLKRKQQGLL